MVKADERRGQRLVGVQPRVCGQQLVDPLIAIDLRWRAPQVRCDAQLTQRDLGALPQRDLCSRVERDGIPYDLYLQVRHPSLGKKVLCEIRSLDLESSLNRGDSRQAEVVKNHRY